MNFRIFVNSKQCHMEKKKVDLLANDLFLINETEDELINSLSGCYSRLYFLENKKGGVEAPLKMRIFKNRAIELSDLKMELVSANLNTKKDTIKVLTRELKECQQMEKNYRPEQVIINASKPITRTFSSI